MNFLRRLFHRHKFEPFELLWADEPQTYVEPRSPVAVWYVGYKCACGRTGYAVPLEKADTK